MLVVFVQGCATTKPTSVDPLAYKDRTKSSTNEDVTVTVAVPTIEEARAIHGINLASKRIQPVWLQVKNDSADTYWFLFSELDPDYFLPSEAAFAFYSDEDEANRQLDSKFQKLQFQKPIRPQSTQAGFVLVNLDEGFKAVDIDLISSKAVKSFSFIIADPEFKADFKLVDFETLYAAEDIINIEDKKALRRVLEELPCRCWLPTWDIVNTNTPPNISSCLTPSIDTSYLTLSKRKNSARRRFRHSQVKDDPRPRARPLFPHRQ